MDDTDHALFPRFSGELVANTLKDTPVVMVTGPRQCGKATLVRDLVAGNREFITLDDDTVLAAARSDPTGFVRALDRTTIDEVQRVPDLLRALKKSVDDDRRAGRFLLTGSANILTLPQVSESLAGRMEIVSLLPLSRAEIRGKKPDFLREAFDSKLGKPAELFGGRVSSNEVASFAITVVHTEDRKMDLVPDPLQVIAHLARELCSLSISTTNRLNAHDWAHAICRQLQS